MAVAAGVRRLHGSVNPESCSAKVFVAQSMASQKNNLRTRMSSRTGYPPMAVSASCLRYRECTRRASPVQRGHTAYSSRDRASMRMVAPTRRTSRTSRPSKYGNKSIPPSSAHPEDPQLPMSVQVSDTPRSFTESAPDPPRPGHQWQLLHGHGQLEECFECHGNSSSSTRYPSDEAGRTW